MSTQKQKDAGLISVLLDRYQKYRLPRTLAIKEKVDRGEVLNTFDITFLKQVISGMGEIRPLLERHPECRKLATSMVTLCHEISGKGLENERI